MKTAVDCRQGRGCYCTSSVSELRKFRHQVDTRPTLDTFRHDSRVGDHKIIPFDDHFLVVKHGFAHVTSDRDREKLKGCTLNLS